jgi:RNA polymerase sigma-70 factor, ECF subfamily
MQFHARRRMGGIQPRGKTTYLADDPEKLVLFGIFRGAFQCGGASSRGRDIAAMNDPDRHDVDRLLREARGGDSGALGEMLELFRNYLTLLSRLQIGRRLQGKLDAADVVQEVFLLAHDRFAQFRGGTESEFIGWLRQILASRLAELARHYYGAQSRDVRLECELAQELDASSRELDRALVARGSSPSQQAARREQAVLLANALERLPDHYREVIILHQLQDLSFTEVAERMERSLDSVKNLWIRALSRLRHLLGDAA